MYVCARVGYGRRDREDDGGGGWRCRALGCRPSPGRRGTKKAVGGGRVFRVRRRRESIFIDKEGGRACLVREK